MPAEIAVGQSAHLLEGAEHQALRMRCERGEHAQPRLLVDHAVEPIIGEAPGLLVLPVSLRHRSLRFDREWRPSATARRRTAVPWPTQKTPASHWQRQGSPNPWRDTTRPRHASAAAATGTRQRTRG